MFKKKVKLYNQKIVFDDFFKIEKATLSYQKFNGRMSVRVDRLNFLRGDSVAVLLYNKDRKKFILTNQYRYPTYDKDLPESGWLTETIAGMIDEGESPKAAAKREIMEEVGYQIKNIKPIAQFYVSPGGSSEQIFLFYAVVRDKHKITTGGGLEREDENIQIVEWSPKEIRKFLKKNLIHDAKTLIALQWWENNC